MAEDEQFPIPILIRGIVAGDSIFSYYPFIERAHIFIHVCKIFDLSKQMEHQLNLGKMQSLDLAEIKKEIALLEGTFASFGLEKSEGKTNEGTLA